MGQDGLDEAWIGKNRIFDVNKDLYSEIYSIDTKLGHAKTPPPTTPPAMPGFLPPPGLIPPPGMPPFGFGPGVPMGLLPPMPPIGVPPVDLSERRSRRRSRSRDRSRKRSRSRDRRHRSRDKGSSRSRSRISRSRSRRSHTPERRKSPSPFRSSIGDSHALSSERQVTESYQSEPTSISPSDMNDVLKLRDAVLELENVVKLKDEQLDMKEERSNLKDISIENLKREMEDQYYKHQEEVSVVRRELDETKNMLNMYDSEKRTDGQLEQGEKFQMIKEIRQKSKLTRETQEQLDVMKRRETQLRETCEAWKKEVDIVREESLENSNRLKEENGLQLDKLKYKFQDDQLRLKAENDELVATNALLQRENETLRTENEALKQPVSFPGNRFPGHGNNFREGFQDPSMRGRGRGGRSRGGAPRGRGRGMHHPSNPQNSNSSHSNHSSFPSHSNHLEYMNSECDEFSAQSKYRWVQGQ